MKILLTVLALLFSGCAVKPAPICLFCDQEVGGQIYTEEEIKK